ncbi:hypothetical protein [Nocardia sp. alder85J]|uniref:hypothetical protein n=1 Tax=Nocardia sp. alder85J TaxID=2862949 RepID=UPI001CD33149|nr:hypothetical protein [Nocardia sp. alder85J]MCX4095951.1 hypothetical protein [Nocardia sp. alder85J]
MSTGTTSPACPSCAWPDPAVVSAHGSTRYLRCVCGRWLITCDGALIAAPGGGAFDTAAAPLPR